MEQLDEDMRAMTVPFGKADEDVLAAQLEHIRPLYCRMCGQCDTVCPKGLPVADVLRYLSYAEGYGQYQLGRESFMTLPREARDVRCSSCSTCSVECPNGVRVAERLARAQELFA
jgi:LSD1 subclass zinc finger protein